MSVGQTHVAWLDRESEDMAVARGTTRGSRCFRAGAVSTGELIELVEAI